MVNFLGGCGSSSFLRDDPTGPPILPSRLRTQAQAPGANVPRAGPPAERHPRGPSASGKFPFGRATARPKGELSTHPVEVPARTNCGPANQDHCGPANRGLWSGKPRELGASNLKLWGPANLKKSCLQARTTSSRARRESGGTPPGLRAIRSPPEDATPRPAPRAATRPRARGRSVSPRAGFA